MLSYYSFFTKYSLLGEYGFTAGLGRRLVRKFLPNVPPEGTIEYVLRSRPDAIPFLLSEIERGAFDNKQVEEELNMAIHALGAKVVAFGLDGQIRAKYVQVEQSAAPFEQLLHDLVAPSADPAAALDAAEDVIKNLRRNKNKIGTSLHLTLTTRRILEYGARLRKLLELRANPTSPETWRQLLEDYQNYDKQRNSLRRYVRHHTDLLALEVVEHTSQKGERYVADNRQQYWDMFRRSLFGGGIIAVFALLKLVLSSFELSPGGDALVFSINYALCFVLVKQFGGIIATKQPAMTASTIAKDIRGNSSKRYAATLGLTGRVFRSQLVSILGNFLMALTIASLLVFAWPYVGLPEVTTFIDAKYLIKNVVPSGSLVFFAATAGCFLALAGLISGYVDNKVVASDLPYRLRHSRLFGFSAGLARFAEKKAGAFSGNVVLGFMLGCAFLAGRILPFAVDIRHIAFSSANVGFAMTTKDLAPTVIAWALCGALLIGLVNLAVSFSITLYLALKSRRVVK